MLFNEAGELLCRAICEWAGVPLAEAEVSGRTRDFEPMIGSPTALVAAPLARSRFVINNVRRAPQTRRWVRFR